VSEIFDSQHQLHMEQAICRLCLRVEKLYSPVILCEVWEDSAAILSQAVAVAVAVTVLTNSFVK
jgi:hypothetical protein